MFGRTNRREFIAAVGGAAAWPLVASGQQPAMPVIGVLNMTSQRYGEAMYVPPLLRGLDSIANDPEGCAPATAKSRW
jgi:hypothetical protein